MCLRDSKKFQVIGIRGAVGGSDVGELVGEA